MDSPLKGTALLPKDDKDKVLSSKPPQEKLDILGQHFGVRAIKLPRPSGGNEKRYKKYLKRLVKNGNVIGHDK